MANATKGGNYSYARVSHGPSSGQDEEEGDERCRLTTSFDATSTKASALSVSMNLFTKSYWRQPKYCTVTGKCQGAHRDSLALYLQAPHVKS